MSKYINPILSGISKFINGKEEAMRKEIFMQYAWKFSFADGNVIAPAMKLFGNGSIGAYVHRNERCWELRGNVLCLQNISGVTTAKFTLTHEDEIGVCQLDGVSIASPGVALRLERIRMPSLRDDTPADGMPAAVKIISGAKTSRKNLVFISAGPKTCHTSWPKFIDDEDRNWDIFTSWYGDDVPDQIPFGEFFCHQPRTHKLSAFCNVARHHPWLMEYENIWLPDDDIEVSWKDINRMFNIFDRTGLSLAQPSLRVGSDCHINHPITQQDTRYLLRYTTFVEIMCPLFSKDLLEACLPLFDGTGQPYIVDHLMMGVEGRVPGKAAIIDDIAVTHSRPMATNYDFAPLVEEGEKLVSLYSNLRHTDRYDVIGGIYRDGALL